MTPTYEWHLPHRVLTIGRRPLVMGIVNVTPDSFSDGGKFLGHDAAVAHALSLAEQGADILDIGGESTRPGSEAVSLEEELRRVLPVVERLAAQVSLPISVDTSKAEVARQALAAGASIINDVTALAGDLDMPEVARSTCAGVILMHMQGSPQTMQINPQYADVVREVRLFFEKRLAALAEVGIGAEQTVLDPGIGFGKNLEHNLTLLTGLNTLQELGRPLCLGVSRKGFINRILGRPGKVDYGVGGTLGVLLYAMARGAVQTARVHDVAAAREAMTLFLALAERSGA